MPKPNILISIDTDADTSTEEFGRAFLQSLCDTEARLMPEKLGTSERYDAPFLGKDDFIANWWAMRGEMRVDGQWVADVVQGPMWKRKSPLTSRGMVEHGFLNRRNQKISSMLWFESRWARDVNFEALFNAWAQLSRPEIAMLHVFTAPELRSLDQAAYRSFHVGSFGNGSRPGLPNMGWAMVYGGDYAAEVNVAQVRAAGFSVEASEGRVYVQVTEKLSDVVENFAYFSERRAKLKSLFRSDLFWIEGEPELDA